MAFTDPKNNLNVSVNRQLMPTGYSPSENFTLTVPENQSGFKLMSHEILNQNGNQIYSNVYQMKVNGTTITKNRIVDKQKQRPLQYNLHHQ